MKTSPDWTRRESVRMRGGSSEESSANSSSKFISYTEKVKAGHIVAKDGNNATRRDVGGSFGGEVD